jgi:hypothetical protein
MTGRVVPMARKVAHAWASLAVLSLVLGVDQVVGAQTPDTSNRCSPNGSACVFASHGYANGTGGMCIGGTCTFCKEAACGAACMGLRSQEQIACSRAVIQAQIAASQRQQVADKEKAEMLGILQRELREASDTGFLARLSDADLAGYPAKIRAEEARVTAISADLGLPTQDWQASDAKTDDLVTKEKACRAAPQCMADRQAKALRDAMCADLAEIRNMQERIRIERANPGGVVDLQELHDDGETIQRDQADLASKKAEHLRLIHKPFTETVCR